MRSVGITLTATATMRLEQTPSLITEGARTDILIFSHRTARQAETGQVIVFFALLIPVIFAIGAIVIDMGNKRARGHLQTQVDAAALAGGGSFVGCFLNPDGPTGANAQIQGVALAYAGDTRRDANTANLQFQEPNDVYAAINSASYWSSANAGDPPSTGYALDYTMPPVDSDEALLSPTPSRAASRRST